jgi:hypothetical protein
MTLLAARQEVSKKRAQASPLGTPGIAALQRERREITYAFLMLCLTFCHHARQILRARAFALK